MLGIIGCQVLEDAIMRTIADDDDVRSVLIVNTGVASSLCEKLIKAAPDKKVLLVENDRIPSIKVEGFTVLVRLMPISLHQIPIELRETVIAEALKMEMRCKVILLFYGMCGDAFKNFDFVINRLNGPTVILRDRKEEIVDDCIGAELGGTEEYLRFLLTTKRGFPMNSMWAANWRHFMQETQLLGPESDLDEARFVFACMDYGNAVKIESGTADKEEYERDIRTFADVFNFVVIRFPGSLNVFKDSYKKAKEILFEG